ncbi:hypothetical protein like AT5G57200 [Hibiscus trionum]|uniref:ENTH domain-containing protein n=1 Tax=Hibiscus trionum TaxID=183268 RepID=A0A9W7M640_HIBTR|nr:hypothetical protein like AT5G57200 [Hibiscus trionum]
MGTWETLKKAYGTLKDQTRIGLAKVNSNFKELDIAIVKATNHVECPPKERHVRKIFAATSASRPQADTSYCIRALAKRLSKTRSWIVATKILILIHRTLREGDSAFRDELLNYTHRRSFLRLSHFRYGSSRIARDCSAWVRTYALFLDERLQCFRVLQYDIEAESLIKSASVSPSKAQGRTMTSEELMDELSALQQLLSCLISCRPKGAVCNIFLIQYALALVLKESYKICCAINDRIMNLVDVVFEMSQDDAVKALDIYKRAGQQVKDLDEFCECCKGLELAKNIQFPRLRQPPPSFIATMEEHVKGTPETSFVRSEYGQREKASSPAPQGEAEERRKQEVNEVLINQQEKKKLEEPQQLISTEAVEIEKSNASALAIIPSETNSAIQDLSEQWELALFTTPRNNTTHVVESTMANGFDKLLLNSLYEDESIRKQKEVTNAGYGYEGMAIVQNPLQQQMMLQQQHMILQQQRQQSMFLMMMVPYQYPQQLQIQHTSYFSPFGDPSYNILPNSISPQQKHMLH